MPSNGVSTAHVPVHSSAFDTSETNELPLDVLESCMLLLLCNTYYDDSSQNFVYGAD